MKRFLCVIVACLLLLNLSACGLSDWSYELLPGDYEIWRVNSKRIILGRTSEFGLTKVAETYVYAFCYNDRFIGIHGLDTGDDDLPASVDIREEYKDHAEYFLVDTQTHEVYGPMVLEMYNEMIALLQTGTMGDWIATRPMPEGAVN
jgi:hypothetical protein